VKSLNRSSNDAGNCSTTNNGVTFREWFYCNWLRMQLCWGFEPAVWVDWSAIRCVRPLNNPYASTD
jgi:hypothetical protein